MIYQEVIHKYGCLNHEEYKKGGSAKEILKRYRMYTIFTSNAQSAWSPDIKSYLLCVRLMLFSISSDGIDKVDASFEGEDQLHLKTWYTTDSQ